MLNTRWTLNFRMTCALARLLKLRDTASTSGQESCDKLLNIPPLHDELFKIISAKKSPATTPRTTPATTATATAIPAPTANKTQIDDDFRALCSCLSVSQLDNYETWIKIGMILNSVGAPLKPLGRGEQKEQEISGRRVYQEMAQF